MFTVGRLCFPFQNGIVSALPFIVMPFVEVGGSWAADKVRERRILTTTNVRKICTSLGRNISISILKLFYIYQLNQFNAHIFMLS